MKISRRIIGVVLLLLLFSLPSLSYSKEEEKTKEEYLKLIEEVKGLLKESPDDAKLHNRLGYYFFKTGDYDHAKEGYAESIKYDKDYSVPYNNLGVIALLKKEYDAAEEHFSDAIKRDPKYAKAVYNLSVTYFRKKRYIKAAKYYLKAKDVDKAYVSEREDSKKSDSELREALEKDPDNKVLKYMIEKRYENKGE